MSPRNAHPRSRTNSTELRSRGAAERAFLVGIEYRARRPAGKQARDAAMLGESTPSRAKAARAGDPADASPNPSAQKNIFGAEESLAELRELTLSAGGEIAGEFLQHRDKPDPATLIGRGKLEEIAAAAKSAEAALVIFDHELSPSQQRNLEGELGTRVVDRTQLILDIFARHARTREGQLQVELAQLEYLMPRLAGRGAAMSQLGGGIGTRGPGETQLETDRRKIYRRIRHIQEQVENVRRIRAQQRQRRESVPVPTVALIGYTNAGKSTLFNLLTQAAVQESPRMFATLDPTIRSVTLPSKRKALLSDTVGFIRNLPHTLVSAFRATLEEVQRAELLLHVADINSPYAHEQERQVERVLEELEAQKQKRIRVLNKIDLLPPLVRSELRDTPGTVHLSARSGAGIGRLLEAIDENLQSDPLCRVRLRIPQHEGKALSMLQAGARIYARKYRDGVLEAEAEMPQSLARKFESFRVP